MAEITVGATFSTSEAFERALARYSELQNVPYVTVNSTLIAGRNESLKNKGKRLYREELKYLSATFGCKHFGQLQSKGKGLRPNQKSFKLDCPARITVVSSKKTQLLHIKHVFSEHNHARSKTAIQHYPEQRRIQGAHREMLNQLDECGVKPSKLREILQGASQKIITNKDLCNMRAQRKKFIAQQKSDIECVLDILQKLEEEDVNASVEIGHDAENTVKIIYMQTGEMKDTFNRFPEILLMDGTYCVNSRRMPLIVFMVEDGFGNGRIVAYCFVSDELQDTVKRAIETFVKFNPESLAKTKTVVIDRDYNEITVINGILPQAHVHLCAYHVSGIFRKETAGEPKATKPVVRDILTSMIYCDDPDTYIQIYNQLINVASPRFINYFNKNWHRCRPAWRNYDRLSSLNIGNRTTNRVEAHNGKVKEVLTCDNTLPEAIQGLLRAHRNKRISVLQEQFEYLYKTCYVHASCQTDDINSVLQTVTPFIASIILKQIDDSLTVANVGQSRDGLIVGGTRKRYKVTTDTCNCTLAASVLIPCRHIFSFRRREGLPIFDKSIVMKRWTLQYNSSYTNTSTSVSDHVSELTTTSTKKTVNQKLEESKTVALEVCGILSHACGSKYEHRLAQLETLKTFWSLGQDIIITPQNAAVQPMQYEHSSDEEEFTTVSNEEEQPEADDHSSQVEEFTAVSDEVEQVEADGHSLQVEEFTAVSDEEEQVEADGHSSQVEEFILTPKILLGKVPFTDFNTSTGTTTSDIDILEMNHRALPQPVKKARLIRFTQHATTPSTSLEGN